MVSTKGKFTKPIGYVEKIGRCFIKKVSNYGKKYKVSDGQVFWRFADIHQARKFAKGRLAINQMYEQHY